MHRPARHPGPQQNRVTPYGDLVATPERGLVFGNRGCLHDAYGRIVRRQATRRWIACRLEFRGRRRAIAQPGRYTELFFLDEATALAAGHRPCAECRREDHRRFADWWAQTYGERGVAAIDRRLDAERAMVASQAQGPDESRRSHRQAIGDLPDATMVDLDGAAWLVLGSRLRRWTPGGYAEGVTRPAAEVVVDVITPPSLVGLLRSGWQSAVPLLHPSAGPARRPDQPGQPGSPST